MTYSRSHPKKHLGQLVDLKQAQVVQQQNVATVITPEAIRVAQAARSRINPAVERCHEESAERWASVYSALTR